MVPIVFVGENSGWLMFPGRLAKREKVGSATKMYETSLICNHGEILAKGTQGL